MQNTDKIAHFAAQKNSVIDINNKMLFEVNIFAWGTLFYVAIYFNLRLNMTAEVN